MRLDILESKDNVRLVMIDGKMPKLIAKEIGIIFEMDGNRFVKDFCLENDKTMNIDIPNTLQERRNLEFRTSRAFLWNGKLYIPVEALRDANVVAIDIVDNRKQVVKHILRVEYTDASSKRCDFDVTVGVEYTEEGKKVEELRDDWCGKGIDVSLDDIRVLLQYYNIEKKQVFDPFI